MNRQPPVPDDPDYSATELASHWIQRPAPRDDTLVDTTRVDTTPVDGTKPLTVLRFGPGVPPTPPPTPTAHAVPGRTRRPSPARRFALPTLVLLCVLAFLAWQRYGPTVAVRAVAVHTDGVVPTGAAGSGCGGTADVVGVVETDGRPGTLTYRWLRSDGSASGVLSEKVRKGQDSARLHLLWTFSGGGIYEARADLEILTPTRHTAGAAFTYACRADSR